MILLLILIGKTRYRLRKFTRKNKRKQHDIALSVERRLKVTKCCPWLGFSGFSGAKVDQVGEALESRL